MIGTYNSGCAAEEIPILNKVHLAMISPGNTNVCLTEPSPICEDGQPPSLYPTGERNYVRVLPNDAYQGAALAEFAKEQGINHPYVLYASKDPTSTGQAENFRGGAEAIGLQAAGFETWDQKAKGYTDLFKKVGQSDADGVVVAGLIEENGAQVIKDKAAVLGSNEKLPLIAFDGFAQQSTIDESGSAAHGMFASVPGRAPENLTGNPLVQQLEAKIGGATVEQFAPYAGEAAAVLLLAIETGGADRDGIVKAMFASHGGGVLGRYTVTRAGDPSVGPITVLKADGSFATFKEVVPKPADVTAARG